MIKVLELRKTKRKPSYYKVLCPHCDSILVCELEDVWMDDPYHDIGRITCPVCRTKFNFRIAFNYDGPIDQHPFWSSTSAIEVGEDVYDNALMDVLLWNQY